MALIVASTAPLVKDGGVVLGGVPMAVRHATGHAWLPRRPAWGIAWAGMLGPAASPSLATVTREPEHPPGRRWRRDHTAAGSGRLVGRRRRVGRWCSGLSRLGMRRPP